MNSFIENVNYVANLDNKYGRSVEIFKNNLSLKSIQHDIELKFSYYNNDDKKIHSIVYSEPGVLVGGIDDTLLSFKTLVESSITGSEFTCTVSSSVQDFVINNTVVVNINITSNSDTYKTYELEMKVITAGAVTYDVFGEVKDSLKVLPSLATITASDVDAMVKVYEIQENVNTVASNIVGLNSIVASMTEILLADDNAAIATTKALESSDSRNQAETFAQQASVSALSVDASNIVHRIGDETIDGVKTFTSNIVGNINGNAGTASKLKTARAITLSGDVSGSVSFDGSNNVNISTTIGANSVILGIDTTGNYVAGLTQGTGISITGSVGEGWSPNVSLADVGTAGTYRSVTTDAKGRITAGTNPTTVGGYGLTDVYTKTESNTTLALKINNSEKGVANGVSTLDINGKVVLTQIPDSILGQLEYIGIWDFATLPTATQKGQYWIASVSGNGYVIGDWAVWNGTAFDKVDNTDAVATVAGRTGNVVLTKTDVGLANVDNTADSAKPVSTAQQTAFNLKANLASPVFTGNVTGLGVATGTSFNSITGLSSTVPVVNGVATIGTSTTVAKADHIHPSDTTKITKVASTDNAIVRFNGTTGDVQNSAITIDDNGNVGSGTQSFNGFGGSGFKNLIINGNKQVNQMGVTTTDNAYNYDNHYKVGNNWFQFISGKNIVSGESYTLSWEGSATAGYYIGTAGALTINAQTFIPIANGETITLTITSGKILWIKFASNSSGSTYNKVQLENGTIPTPYEHRLYELEESLVQNCYEIVKVKYWNIATASNQPFGGSISYKKVKDKIPIVTTVGAVYSNSYSIVTESLNVDSLYIYALSSASGQLSYASTFYCDARPY